MGSVYLRVPRGETEAPINFFLTSGGPVSGATIVYAVRDGDTPDSWLDFNDNTFKTAGWTTRQAALTGSGTQAGLYTAVPGLDLSAMTNLPAATDVLVIEFEVTAPAGLVGFAFDYLLIDDRLEDETFATQVWTEALPGAFLAGSAGFILGTNLDVLVSSRATQAQILSDATPFPGANIDAAISSRAVPGDAMTLTVGAIAAIATDVWGEPVPGAFGGGTAGFILGTNLDALVSSRSSHTPAQASTAVWSEPVPGAFLAGSAGFVLGSLTAAPSVAAIVAGVWSEPLPGAFGAGSAGFNLDVAISTRNAVVPMTAALSQLEHDATQAAIAALNDPTAAAISTAVWSEPVPGAFAPGEAGEVLGNLSGGLVDWTATEREEIRFRLGMNGVQTDPTLEPDLAQGGVKLLDIIAGDSRVIDDGGGNYVEEHLDFATGAVVVRRYDLFGFNQTSQITTSNNPFQDAGLNPNAGFMFRNRTL